MPDFCSTMKTLLEKATPGPWQFCLHPVDESSDTLRGPQGESLRRIDAKLTEYLRNHAEEILRVVEAARLAKSHIEELREAWMRGCLSEHDGLGGTRSNRNVDVDVALREALAALDAGKGE